MPILEKKRGYAGNVSFVSDGHIQMHIAEQDLDVNFKTGHYINPVEKFPTEIIVIPMATAIPIIPNKLPCLEVSGDDITRIAKINIIPDIR